MTAYNAKESKVEDAKMIIELMDGIHARSSNNLHTAEDVQRLHKHMMGDAMSILNDV